MDECDNDDDDNDDEDECDNDYMHMHLHAQVAPTGRVDKVFDSKMGKLQQERDRQSDALDHRSSFAQQTDGQYSEVRDFLMEGLDHKVVS